MDLKKASPEERKQEYERIAKELGDVPRSFIKKELNHLPEIMGDGEMLLALTSGVLDGNTWVVALTDRRMIFLDKGMLYGLKQTTIDLDRINSVSCKTGLIFGEIMVQDGPSARHIGHVFKGAVVNFTNKVRDALEARRSSGRASSRATQDDDVVSKLERLANLRDRGVLNDNEFADQKAKILAS